MSRRRYISTEISADPKLAELSESGLLPLLLYTWAIPHMDDWGRMTGDARQFKLLVCPGIDVTAKEIEIALEQIAEAKLWCRYLIDGKWCLSIPQETWFKHQSYISKLKREDDSGSNYRAPNGEVNEQRESAHNADLAHVDLDEQRRTPQNAEEHRASPQIAASFSLSSSFSLSPSSNTPITKGANGELESADKENVPSFLQVINAYCQLHQKFDIHITHKERELAKKMIAGGMPVPFIIQCMESAYAAKKIREELDGGMFRPPTSFTYYDKPITDAWNERKKEVANETESNGRISPRIGGDSPRIDEQSLTARFTRSE